MAAYYSSVDALKDLVAPSSSTGDGYLGGCQITKIPENIYQMTDGIEYYSVEVTCKDSTQYGIQAYGQEAIELHKEALGLSEKQIEEEEKEGKKRLSLPCTVAI
jgi:hypothetical protein